MIHSSILDLLLTQHLIKQSQPLQQIGNYGFGNCIAHEIVDKLFHTYGCRTVTDIAKIDDTIKTTWDPNKPIEILIKQIKHAQIFAICTNLTYDFPHLIMYALNNITNTGVFEMNYVTHDFYHQQHTHNTDWPMFKTLGHHLDRTRTLPTLLG